MPRLTYAIADLHGRADLMAGALEAIERHAGGAAQTIVFLGDYVDRGPSSPDILQRLVAGPSGGWRWICLKGNHEAMMVAGLRQPDQLDAWIHNGGDRTMDAYDRCRARLAPHLAWIDALATMHVDAHRVFVHAGVDPTQPLSAQTEQTVLWRRAPRDDQRGHGTRHVVHGHTPIIDGPLRLAGRTDLDTLAWATGRLVVGVFDDAASGGPIDLLEVKGAPA